MVANAMLQQGYVKSCGCLFTKTRPQPKYGDKNETRSKEYSTWKNIHRRCESPKTPGYKDYGGRWIRVSAAWSGPEGYRSFLKDMGRAPSKRHSIERKDPNGNYNKDNCRWGTLKEQAQNKRNTVLIRYANRSCVLMEWARFLDMSYSTLQSRMQHGMTFQQAIAIPAKPYKEIRRPKEYSTWAGMRQRCNNPKASGFAYYGGRGIRVCARWESFAAFLSDMGPAPSAEHEIERNDGTKWYEPGNCYWATPQEQARSRCTSIRLEHAGRTLSLTEWARELGVPFARLRKWIANGKTLTAFIKSPPVASSDRQIRQQKLLEQITGTYR